VVSWEKQPGGVVVVLADRHGRQRTFPLGAGFLLDGQPVTLVRPRAGAPAIRTRTASGSLAPPAALGCWEPDAAAGWRRIRSAVHSYADLEPELLGRVEELIDFVSA